MENLKEHCNEISKENRIKAYMEIKDYFNREGEEQNENNNDNGRMEKLKKRQQ